MESTKQWHIAFTKAGQEQKVCEALRRKKIESFFPINKTLKNSSGKEKIAYKPLLERYVFMYLADEELNIIKNIDGILNFVYWLANPVTISQDDIYLLKRFFNMYGEIHLEKTKVNLNQPATISSHFVGDSEDTVQLTIPALGYIMSAQEHTTRVKVITVPGVASKTNSTNKYAETR